MSAPPLSPEHEKAGAGHPNHELTDAHPRERVPHMSSTTVTVDQTKATEFNISEALRTLADMFYVGSIPTAAHPGQALGILILTPDAEDVTEFAGRMGIEYEVSLTKSGAFHTSAKLPIGEGSTDSGTVAYTSAVLLTVAHITEAAA